MRLLPRDTVRTPRAVVIDADPSENARFAASLAQQGFTVIKARDGKEGVTAVLSEQPAVVAVAAQLPRTDGFETVRRIRRHTDAVVIMIGEDAEAPTVRGFRSGADDYVAGTIGSAAFAARVEAHLRRARPDLTEAAPTPDPDASWVEHGPIALHDASRRVQLDGDDIALTRSEFEILSAFLRHRDEVFSKTRLALVLRHTNGISGDRVTDHDRHAVEVHVMNLRRKLSPDTRSAQWIQTVRGHGYRLHTAPAALGATG